jgi:hypothetical protein
MVLAQGNTSSSNATVIAQYGAAAAQPNLPQGVAVEKVTLLRLLVLLKKARKRSPSCVIYLHKM